MFREKHPEPMPDGAGEMDYHKLASLPSVLMKGSHRGLQLSAACLPDHLIRLELESGRQSNIHLLDGALGVLLVVVIQSGVLDPGNPVLSVGVVQHALEGTSVVLRAHT